jgi:uncharacterized membrane protein
MMIPTSLFPVGTRSWAMEIKYGTPAYWIGLGMLVVVLLVALLKGYREWQEIHDVEEPDSPDDLLRSFREAHARGELDDDEFQRVERRLSHSSASGGPTGDLDDPARSRDRPPPSSLEHRVDVPTAGSTEDKPGSGPAGPGRPGGPDCD